MINLWTKHPFRIIVIDNGSTDGTREWLEKMKKAGLIGKLILSKENKMLTDSFNDGLEHVDSEIFITAADDLIPPYKKHPYGDNVCWLTMLLATFEANPKYGSINFYGPRQGFEPFRAKRWPSLVKTADEDKLKKLHSIVFEDGNDYGLKI